MAEIEALPVVKFQPLTLPTGDELGCGICGGGGSYLGATGSRFGGFGAGR